MIIRKQTKNAISSNKARVTIIGIQERKYEIVLRYIANLNSNPDAERSKALLFTVDIRRRLH